MDLLLQLQSDLAAKINSESYFQYNSCATFRSLVITQEIARRLPHLTAKNGKLGCGIIVNMPVIHSAPGDDGTIQPVGEVAISLDVVENPELNFLSGGTQLTCEEVARAVRSYLHSWAEDGVGSICQDTNAILPIEGIAGVYPGCAGYRVNFKMTMVEPFVPQCATVLLTESDLTVTLATATDGAQVYYTTDGSFPGPGNQSGPNGASTAELYAAPFAVSSGTNVRAAAFLAGYRGSVAANYTVT